jgi:hypothetical protein
MSRPLPSFSRLIEQERQRWVPCRRALSAADQAVFDRLFEGITQHVQGDVSLSRPWSFEAVILAVLLEQQKRITEVLSRLGEYEGRGCGLRRS